MILVALIFLGVPAVLTISMAYQTLIGSSPIIQEPTLQTASWSTSLAAAHADLTHAKADVAAELAAAKAALSSELREQLEAARSQAEAARSDLALARLEGVAAVSTALEGATCELAEAN
jgi:methionine-rich copper-binding protein CopC